MKTRAEHAIKACEMTYDYEGAKLAADLLALVTVVERLQARDRTKQNEHDDMRGLATCVLQLIEQVERLQITAQNWEQSYDKARQALRAIVDECNATAGRVTWPPGVAVLQRARAVLQGARGREGGAVTQREGHQRENERQRKDVCAREAAPEPLRLKPIFRSDARLFVAKYHSHNRPPCTSIFQIGAEVGGELVGVVIGALPLARTLMDGYTLEITRVATTRYPNACSKLYAAAVRAARALGYRRCLTYTLASEQGTALRATGWSAEEELREHNVHGWENRGGARQRTVNLFGEINVPTEAKRRWWITC